MNRKPPKFIDWTSPKGICRLCHGSIIEKGKHNIRKNWHKECFNIYAIMTRPQHARKYVWDYYRGICQGCDKSTWSYTDTWQVDHIKPLFESNNDISYWKPENLTLLCSNCHKKKTKEEARRRSLVRKNKVIDK